MTQEEFKQYQRLNNKFINACNNIARILKPYKPKLGDVWEFTLDGDEVKASGGYSCMGEYNDVVEFFQTELLTYSDSQLREWTERKIEQKRHEEEKERLECCWLGS